MHNPQPILWNKIVKTLDEKLPDWQNRICQFGQVSAVEKREKGYQFSDQEIFGGIIKAVLSNSTDWSKIERVLPELNNLFEDFDLNYYSKLDSHCISNRFIPWFKQRRAGSMTMEKSLIYLIETSRKLLVFREQTGSLHQFFVSLSIETGDNPINLVHAIGSQKSKYKLPALGIPIAAEAMKNIGYDVAKPDRHINRAMGSLKLVQFSHWTDSSNHMFPETTETEQITVMKILSSFAETIGIRVSFLDNAIWLLCSKSGLYMNNNQLSILGI